MILFCKAQKNLWERIGEKNNRKNLCRFWNLQFRERIARVTGVLCVCLILRIRGYLLILPFTYSLLILLGYTFEGRNNGENLNFLVQLQRRKEVNERLKKWRAMNGEEGEEEQLIKDLQFLDEIRPTRSWSARAFYQLFVMFILTLLPIKTLPDPELLK